jgi:hypothetical protein
VGTCVTWHVPQLQAPDAVGPSKTSWLGDAEKPDGQGDVCAGAKATSVHPVGTVTHEPGELAQGSGGGGGPVSGGATTIEASGTEGGAPVFPASGLMAGFEEDAVSSLIATSIGAAS